ncbi:MAG: hypothetical protein PHT57_14655 [Rhodoferax sp.]|nr:hypothetical protein [Rhodoferax sp.]
MQVDEAKLLDRINRLASAVELMAAMLGTRLDREQLAQRLGVHRNTLRVRLAADRTMPRPGPDGRWLLSEIVEWEQRR